MCIHQKEITTRNNQHFLVKCGKCPACLHEKALRRTSKINDHYNPNQHGRPLFITLTYHNDYVPHIYQDDYERWFSQELDEVPVYREHDIYVTTVKGVRQVYDKGLKLLGTFSVDTLSTETYQFSFDDLDIEKLSNFVLPKLHHKSHGYDVYDKYGRVGVLWSAEIPNFFKRFRSFLKRKYQYDLNFSYYYVGEYGTSYHRPHYHIIIYPHKKITKEEESWIYSAVVDAWPFQDWSNLPRSFESALSPASYLGTYVSRDQMLPSIFFINHQFRPFARHSLGFGFGQDDFSRTSLQKKIDERNLTIVRKYRQDGVPTVRDVPIPSYVINHYWPKFKGYSRLSFHEIHNLLRFCLHLSKLGWYYWDVDPFDLDKEQSYHKSQLDQLLPFISFLKQKCEWTQEDTDVIIKRIRNVLIREKVDDITDFAWYYFKSWQVRDSTIHNADYVQISQQDVESQFTHYYNTLQFVYNEIWMNPLYRLPDSAFYKIFQKWHGQHPNFQLDPNYYPDNICKTAKLHDLYFKYRKNRKISSLTNSSAYG